MSGIISDPSGISLNSPATQFMHRQVEFFLIQKMLHFRDHSAAPFSSLYLAREGHPNRTITISLALGSVTRFGVRLKRGKEKSCGRTLRPKKRRRYTIHLPSVRFVVILQRWRRTYMYKIEAVCAWFLRSVLFTFRRYL